MTADVAGLAGLSAFRNPLLVEKRREPSRACFESEYLQPPGRPVVLTDVASNWPAIDKWTFDYFRASFGDSIITATDNFIASSRTCRLSLRGFLRYCDNPDAFPHLCPAATRLYGAIQPFCAASELMRDFQWPLVLDNLYNSGGQDLYDWYLRSFGVILIGPSGTVTPLHEDLFATHAFLAQIVGRKRFVFYPPATATPASGPSNLHAESYEVILHPGELIVFPQGWLHEVTSLDRSISLTFNFVNQTNIMAHLSAIFRDLPAWLKRLNTPEARKAFAIPWQNQEVHDALKASEH